MTCHHCKDRLTAEEVAHNCEHSGLCCDCFDLSFGMPLEEINEERAKVGRPPIKDPWPVQP